MKKISSLIIAVLIASSFLIATFGPVLANLPRHAVLGLSPIPATLDNYPGTENGAMQRCILPGKSMDQTGLSPLVDGSVIFVDIALQALTRDPFGQTNRLANYEFIDRSSHVRGC